MPESEQLSLSSDFNMAYDMLNHLRGGNLVKPQSDSKTPLIGQMLLFNQAAFMNAPSTLATGQNASSAMSEWIQKSMVLYNPTNWGWPTSGLLNWEMPSVTASLSSKAATARSSLSGFDEHGLVYFPSACAKGQKCPIHVALHGCQQGIH